MALSALSGAGAAAFGILAVVKGKKRKRRNRHERKDVDHGHLSGIYRRSLDLVESAGTGRNRQNVTGGGGKPPLYIPDERRMRTMHEEELKRMVETP